MEHWKLRQGTILPRETEATFEKLLYAEEREGEQANARYREDVEARFTRKHPAIYEPAELQRFLNPALKDALRSGGEATLRALWNEEAQGLYSLRLFTAEFCELLLEECESTSRPGETSPAKHDE